MRGNVSSSTRAPVWRQTPLCAGGEGRAQIKDQVNSGMWISAGSPIASRPVLSALVKHETESPVQRRAQHCSAWCCL